MRLIAIPAALVLLSACGSSWSINDEGVNRQCEDPNKKQWFPDGDGDGWGDDVTAELHCNGEQPSGLVRNNLDCDDTDAAISARVGAFCPHELIPPGGDGQYVGVINGDTEFVAFFGTTPLINSWPADANCGFWGHDVETGSYWTSEGMVDRTPVMGHLATFDSSQQFGFVRDAVGNTNAYAGYIGIASDGTSWAWEDGTDGTSINGIGWCDGIEPEPADYDYAAAVVPEGGDDWCLSTPDIVDNTTYDYDWDKAHFICERNAPDPAEYRVFPVVGGGDSGDESEE